MLFFNALNLAPNPLLDEQAFNQVAALDIPMQPDDNKLLENAARISF